jgi:hypothetical protein
MSKSKRHSQAEIAAKLVEADDLERQGKLQSDIASALGVSVMTLHRWRKMPTPNPPVSIIPNGTEEFEQEVNNLSKLKEENSRLRRLVADILVRTRACLPYGYSTLDKISLQFNMIAGISRARAQPHFPAGA